MAVINTNVPTAPRYQPELIDPAYDDPDAVRRVVEQAGPYPNLAGAAGYAGFQLPTMAWWRSTLGPAARESLPGSSAVLDNPHFIEAARRVFESEVVRPTSVTINLNGPMPIGAAHLDTPSFRGSTPMSPWLLSIMGSSGLFERWAVRVPAALTWFYPGEGAGYEYWPDGPGGPSKVVAGPFGNVALVGDNDYMFHRVGAIGDPQRYDAVKNYGSQSLASFENERWIVRDGDEPREEYARDEMRISLLWRSIAFESKVDERRYDEHLDDLDAETLVDVFVGDLRDRGVRCARPMNYLTDPEWVEMLNATYGFAGIDAGA